MLIKIVRLMIASCFIALVACSGGTGGDTNNTQQASCDSQTVNVFCYTLDGVAYQYSGDTVFEGLTIIQNISGWYYDTQGNAQVSLLTPFIQISLVYAGAPGVGAADYLFDGTDNFASYNVFDGSGGLVAAYTCSGAAETACINYGSHVYIESFGELHGFIRGSFDIKLCDTGGSNCKNLSGRFNVVRQM